MSVIMTLRVEGDAKKLEEQAAADPDAIRAISDHAKEHGLIAHRFYGTDDGKIMVVDEWPSAEDFQSFFDHDGPRIRELMDAAGVTSPPEVTFWRKLETHDEVGWEGA
jgi:heme-degrading monooxygenase HmoA